MALVTQTDWQAQAACRDTDTDVFFPVRDADAGAAKAICATCPVVDACREHAIAARIPDGVWGGLTPVERQRLVRRRQKAARRDRRRDAERAA